MTGGKQRPSEAASGRNPICHCEGRKPRSNPGKGPSMANQYYVYIMTNKANTVLYTGVTNDLRRRAYEHREGLIAGFTKRYRVIRLVYYEVFDEPSAAINREKQIKAGPRRRKMELIDSVNPNWRDLYGDI